MATDSVVATDESAVDDAIIQFDAAGRIFHIITAPIPAGLRDVLDEAGEPYLWIADGRAIDPETHRVDLSDPSAPVVVARDLDEVGAERFEAYREAMASDMEAMASRAFAGLRRPGRDAIYDRKAREASDFLLTGDPATAPLLAAEAVETGLALSALVAAVHAYAHAEALGIERIEVARRVAKIAIAGADTVDEIDAAVTDFADTMQDMEQD